MKQVCDNLNSSKLTAYKLDASNEKELKDFISNYDVVINALFYSFNETVAKTAIEAGVHSVDLGGHIGHITDRCWNTMKRHKQKVSRLFLT